MSQDMKRTEDVEEDPSEEQLFVDCARYGEIDTLRSAMSERPDIVHVARDPRGNTALHMACANGHADVAEVLVSAAPELVRASNSNGSTPLHWAANCGSEQIVAMLLAAGADPTATDTSGKTPLDLAQRGGNEKVAVALLRAMPDPPPHRDGVALQSGDGGDATVSAEEDGEEIDPETHCATCGKGGNDLSRCSRCKTTMYCSRECQRLHWKIHKITCKPPES